LGIFFNAYIGSDFFGRGIFIALFALSIVSWIILIRKMFILRTLSALCKRLQKDVAANQSNLFAITIPNYSPYGQVYKTLKEKALALLEKNRHFMGDDTPTFLSRSDIDSIEADLDTSIALEIKHLEKDLFILSTAVSLAPFLGILGTVWGILLSLFAMQKESSMHSNSMIMDGLATALATTVLGLVIAIPALIAYNYLKNSIRCLYSDMHSFSNNLLSTLELQYRSVSL